MSDENGKARTGFGKLLSEHPTIIILGLLGLWTTILIGGFALWFHGAVESKNDRISIVEGERDDCQEDYDSLIKKLDALGYATDIALDRYVLPPTVFCSRRMVPILEGEVIVGFVGASIYEDIAVFTIYNNITKEELKFRAPENRNLEFQYRDQTYIVYFLGFEKEDEKACAKISVEKKQRTKVSTDAPSLP